MVEIYLRAVQAFVFRIRTIKLLFHFDLYPLSGTDTGFEFSGGVDCEAPKAARNKAPKMRTKVGAGEWVSTRQLGWGLERSCAPSQEFLLNSR